MKPTIQSEANKEIKALGNMLFATDHDDTQRLASIAKRVNEIAGVSDKLEEAKGILEEYLQIHTFSSASAAYCLDGKIRAFLASLAGMEEKASAITTWPQLNEFIDEYIADYELRCDEGDHTPSEFERFLITDAIGGLIQEMDDAGMVNISKHQDQPTQGDYRYYRNTDSGVFWRIALRTTQESYWRTNGPWVPNGNRFSGQFFTDSKHDGHEEWVEITAEEAGDTPMPEAEGGSNE